MRVEFDLFSGRVNPSWALDDAAADELRGLVAQRAPSAGPEPSVPSLGYRGFLCTARDQRYWGLWKRRSRE